MSNSLEAAVPGTPVTQALEWLRGRPNPFESLVRPQRPDDRFLDIHVPALLRAPRERLQQVIDSYRLQEYRAVRDLPDSRVVTILGPRGAGKTHLLEAVAHRADGHRQLLVRPSYFEPDVNFDEYVLQHMVNALLTEDPVHGGRHFEAIALTLTRRLLRQTLTDLGAVERLQLLAPPGWPRWRLYWGGGQSVVGRLDSFLNQLSRAGTADDLRSLAGQCQLAPDLLLRLVQDHVHRCEQGDDALPAIRRQLYVALARAALGQDTKALTQFLEADYTPAGARPFYRTEIIRQVVLALIETCALVRLPVVVAFDNLEGLLAPHGKLEVPWAQALFDHLAQAVDASRGLLFLLLAEEELYREIRKHIQPFALSRLEQGVPVHGVGPVDAITLRPPDKAELQQLIAGRISKVLQDGPPASGLAPTFPFEARFLADQQTWRGLGLRGTLLRLRDEYSRVVYRREMPVPETAPVAKDASAELTHCWTDQLSAVARRTHNREWYTQYHDLHAGLRQLLQQMGPMLSQGLTLAEVRPMNTSDGHALYSQVTVIDWRAQDHTANGRPAFRLCVGLLLAGGKGMPNDLKAKFVPLAETTHQPDAVVVLWPAAAQQELPPATSKVWDNYAKQFHATLHRLSNEELHKLLALPEWIKELRGQSELALPETAYRDFLGQKCQTLLALVTPPAAVGSASHAH
jgi:hypothetical protein